jgi:hypothetical protein
MTLRNAPAHALSNDAHVGKPQPQLLRGGLLPRIGSPESRSFTA